MPKQRDARTGDRWLARGALCGLAVFVLGAGVLHVAQPSLDPARTALSYYVHGRCGGWLTGGLLGLGLGSLGVALLLRRTFDGACRAAVTGGVGLWSVGVLAGAIFPADPMNHWSEPPSMGGLIHGVAALVAFIALPVAALALRLGLREDPRWWGARRWLGGLAALCAISLAAFFASLWPTLGVDRPPVLLGLTERVLLLADLAWLVASTRQALRVASIA